MRGETPTFTRLTPACSSTGGAISVVRVGVADEDGAAALDGVVARFGVVGGLAVGGGARLCRVAGVDELMAARVSATTVLLTTHAGRAVEAAVEAALVRAGAVPASAGEVGAIGLFPEAGSAVEACVLDALSRAETADAVRVLLAQTRLWEEGRAPIATAEEAARLDRLLNPATVAAVGAANVGKSTLLNALARREVAITADVAGTTLDHVGVSLVLDGLVVRWLDTPGWHDGDDDDPAARAAHGLARDAVARADLVLVCGDASSGFIDPGLMGARGGQALLRVGTRGDLGAASGADVVTSARGGWEEGAGLRELAERVSGMLVPRGLREGAVRWVFHEGLRAGCPGRA